MEASRICFGPKSFRNLNNVPLRIKTNLTLFPKRLLKKNTFFSERPTKHELLCVKGESSSGLESTRPLANFSPSLWGDRFLSVPVDESEFEALEDEIGSVMKPKVRDMLMSPHSSDKERISLIHLLISLGIAHYFESQIEEILHRAFGRLTGLISEKDDLDVKLHGLPTQNQLAMSGLAHVLYILVNVPSNYRCGIFIPNTPPRDDGSLGQRSRFKGENGKFKESLAEDIRGMLQLYGAAHLGTPSEDIMDEAISFTRSHLVSFCSQETNSNLCKHVQNALYRARYHSIEILVARQYIGYYEQEEGHDEMLLNFAKLNFNFCRLHYIKELKALTKWWNDLDLNSKLPYTRSRIVEIFFGSVAIYFEPRYSLGRIVTAKITMLMTIVDDTYDAYATLPEVTSFNDAIQKWDLEAIENLPNYMKIIYENLFESVEEIAREMKPRGRTCSVATEENKRLVEAYLAIATWARTRDVPTFVEYMKVGRKTAGMYNYAAYAFIAMEECDEKPLYEWYDTRPKILEALCTACRLKNDIASFETELSRGEVANGVNCYMKQHGVTKEVAVEVLEKMARENYKMMLDEFMTTTTAVPRQILVRVVNIGRVLDLFYKEGDGFSSPDEKMMDLLVSLFLYPFPL